jgi:hypothetical protein
VNWASKTIEHLQREVGRGLAVAAPTRDAAMAQLSQLCQCVLPPSLRGDGCVRIRPRIIRRSHAAAPLGYSTDIYARPVICSACPANGLIVQWPVSSCRRMPAPCVALRHLRVTPVLRRAFQNTRTPLVRGHSAAMATGPRGAFILLEGVDRCGKSTQVAKLAAALQESGVSRE